MTDRDILSQIEQLPDGLNQEMIDFIGYLSEKYNFTGLEYLNPFKDI